MHTHAIIQYFHFFIVMLVAFPIQSMNYYQQSPIYFCQQNDLLGLKRSIEFEKQDINEIRHNTTALIEAVKKNNVGMVHYLLQQGAIVDTFLDEQAYDTAFSWAVKNNCLGIMQLLFEQGIDIKIENHLGNLLEVACKYHNTYNHMVRKVINYHEVVKQLVKWRCNFLLKNASGHAPLHFFVRYADAKDHEFIQSFPNKKNIFNIQTNNGVTPLMICCSNSNTEMVSFLLSCGVSINEKDEIGRTALFHGINNRKITRILLDHGASLHDVDNEGNTVLHRYMKDRVRNKYVCMKIILPWFENSLHHVEVNAQNNDGDTALHLAIRYQQHHEYVIPLLLFYGAEKSLKIKNKQNKAPLDCVYANFYNFGLIQLLKNTPNENYKPFLVSSDFYTGKKKKCYSFSEYEKSELIPYTLPPRKSLKDLAIRDYNEDQTDPKKMKAVITMHRRLRDREYGITKMPERLYIER